MPGKGFRQLLSEAGTVVESISGREAVDLAGQDGVLFVDVRESHERAQSYIPGSVHAPRGFLELIADPEGPIHQPALVSAKRLILYCGSGARSILAGKTLSDMGYGNLASLAGGLQAWMQSGGELER